MPKQAEKLAAKDIAAMLHMTSKNLRKHLRNLEIAKNTELGRYSFTAKQAEAICAKITERIAKEETEEVAA